MITKNLKPEDLVSFKNEGAVLIGSFSRYRKIVGPGKDEAEGTKGVDIETNEWQKIKGDDLGKFVSAGYVKIQGSGYLINKGGGKLIIKNANLLPDVYIFCTSSKVVEKFGESHYNILEISRFGEILYEELRKIDNELYDWAHGRVVYGGAKNPITTMKQLRDIGDFNINEINIYDCFCKPAKYAEEEEYRFVFLTKKQPVPEKTIIKNTNLVNLCSFI
jgi:hypothetical protein